MLSESLSQRGWNVIGTTRDVQRAEMLRAKGYEIFSLEALPDDVWNRATHVVHSIPPAASGDEVLQRYAEKIVQAPKLEWFGYLSTTGVYGDHGGAWVDEATTIKPVSKRQCLRAETEAAFLTLQKEKAVPSHVFRLSGIYGPTRSVVDDVRAGQARRIFKEGQVFSRIHVEDIVHVMLASIKNPSPGEIYNVCDDEPAPAHEVVEYACGKMGVEPPPLIPFEQAELSEMGREFYSSNRRVSNRKIRDKLGVMLKYPTYREGVNALLKG